MRHVTRTYRVALDGSFNRIKLDLRIQIKYVEFKHQLADMLTKGNGARDEWKHLLRLVNIMSFSNFSCSHLSKLTDPRSCRRGWCRKENQEKWNAWLRNRNQWWVWCRRLSLVPQLHWVRVHLTHQGHSNHKVRFGAHQYGETRSERFEWQHCPSEAIWCKFELWCKGNLLRKRQNNPIGTRLSHHNITESRNCVRQLEKVYSNVRQKIGHQLGDDMPESLSTRWSGNTYVPNVSSAATPLPSLLLPSFFPFCWAERHQAHARTHAQHDNWSALCASRCTLCLSVVSLKRSWTRLSRDFLYHQEHWLRKGQTVVWSFTEIDPESKWRNIKDIYNRLECCSMDENCLAARQSRQAVESKGTRFLWFGTLSWQNSRTSSINRSLEGEDWVVHEVPWISWIGSYRWKTSRVQV